MIKKIIHLILVTIIAGAAIAQDVSVRPDHPDEYVVVKGDTLWDISGKFLEKPWQWPAIWQANPQIKNPHLIYPGDRLSLVYINGKPQLQVNRPVERLSPQVRRQPKEAVPPIPWDAIKNFVNNARVLLPGQVKDLPYVVANESNRIMSTREDLTYVRGLDGKIGDEFEVVRLKHIYYDDKGVMKRALHHKYGEHLAGNLEYPDTIWNATLSWRRKNPPVLGYEYWDVAKARLVKTGDPATLKIRGGRTEIKQGDFVLPVDTHQYPPQMMPHAMERIPDGLEVIALTQSTYGAGHYQIVAVNAGRNQQMEPGFVFSAFRPGATVRDNVKYPKGSFQDQTTWNGDKVKLPDEYSAHIIVFRVFDEVSYAMVMDGKRPVREHDILKRPDDTI